MAPSPHLGYPHEGPSVVDPVTLTRAALWYPIRGCQGLSGDVGAALWYPLITQDNPWQHLWGGGDNTCVGERLSGTARLQGYLAHEKTPIPLGTSLGPYA